jgi:ribonuclease BN (tRNA processing enzyme)
VKLEILGAHNCESCNSKMISLLVDDCLAIDAGSLSSSLSFESQQKLKAVLLTHNHYDHIRDIPALAINLYSLRKTIDVYATGTTRRAIMENLLNDDIYPDFTKMPEGEPAIRFLDVEPYGESILGDYRILAVPVNHGSMAVGYQVTSSAGRRLFFAADTGLGLESCWDKVSPDLLVIEVTFPNRLGQLAEKSRHLTPAMLGKELGLFKKMKGYLPSILIVHMDPKLEDEIRAEIELVSRNLGAPLVLAHEGMKAEV